MVLHLFRRQRRRRSVTRQHRHEVNPNKSLTESCPPHARTAITDQTITEALKQFKRAVFTKKGDDGTQRVSFIRVTALNLASHFKGGKNTDQLHLLVTAQRLANSNNLAAIIPNIFDVLRPTPSDEPN